MDTRVGAAGGIDEIGAVPGRWVGADPTGRYVTTVDGGTVYTHDTAALAQVVSHRTGPPLLVATHPAGATVAVLTEEWAVEVWRAGERVATRSTGLAGSPAVTGPLDGPHRAVWLTFTADGSHLLAGLAAADGGPVRLDLLDPATLDRLDSTGALPGGYPDYDRVTPPVDWGEGVTAVAGPPPVGPVAFAANVGDDPHTLAVVEVVDGRLCLHATVAGSALAAQVPGERIAGIAVNGAGTLYVLDSDDILTGFTWGDPDQPPRRIRSDVGLDEALFGEDRDDFHCAGPVFLAGDRLAVPFVGGPGLVVLAFVDPESGRYTGRLDVPAPWRAGFIENGLLWQRAGDRTRLARWAT